MQELIATHKIYNNEKRVILNESLGFFEDSEIDGFCFDGLALVAKDFAKEAARKYDIVGWYNVDSDFNLTESK